MYIAPYVSLEFDALNIRASAGVSALTQSTSTNGPPKWISVASQLEVLTGAKSTAWLKSATVDRSHQAWPLPNDVARIGSFLFKRIAEACGGKAGFPNFTKLAPAPIPDCQIGVEFESMHYNPRCLIRR